MNTSFLLGMLIAFLIVAIPVAAIVILDGEITWWETLLLIILSPLFVIFLWFFAVWFAFRKAYNAIRSTSK